MRAVLKAQINKTDRNDARGIAQMMRVGLYRPDATVRQGKVAELQRQIPDAQESALDANQERATLMETISQLKREVGSA
jgi:hypothetical protein